MLTHLSVRHFATVDQLELEPEAGLTVISGETGAGKSVLIDALSLTLGSGRTAPWCAPAANGPRCWPPSTWGQPDGPRLARRARAGRRRRVPAAPHGARRRPLPGLHQRHPTPLTEVRDLGEHLISIHSQHEHQALLRKDTHRALLDNLAEAGELASTVRERWRDWQAARRAHDDALASAREQTERQELLRFQLEELDALDLAEDELPDLEQEQQRLGNADALIRLCQQAVTALYDGEDGTVNDHLGQVSHWVEEARASDDGLAGVFDTVESARLQVEAAAEDLRHYLEKLDLDPERLNQVEERLGQAYTLARKHRLRPEELVEHHRRLAEEADTLEHFDEHLEALAAAERTARDAYMEQAQALGRRRRDAAGALTRKCRSNSRPWA